MKRTQLNLSEHTVKNYLFRIIEKLGLSNRVELVLYAIARLNQPQLDASSARSVKPSELSRSGPDAKLASGIPETAQ